MDQHSFSYNITVPFNLETTLKTHGWFQLTPFYWDEENKVLNWAVNINDNPKWVTVRQEKTVSNSALLQFAVHTESSDPDEKEIIGKFRHIFNLDLDLGEFYKISAKHPLLDQVEKRGMGRLMRAGSVYEDIFKSICGTNVQWKQAVKMINNIAQLGEPVPGTEYRIFPKPKAVLNAGEKFLKDVGRVGYRSSYLIELCQRFADGESEALAVENGEKTGIELYKYFLEFKGIGKTTARYLSALYGYFEDMAVDSLVLSYMAKTHFGGEKPTEKQVEEFYAKFGRWRYLAYWMEFIIAGGWKPDQN
ncbi:MAG: hypothetical protein GWP06_10070 [Actinobacteria bacterium]|nr:hypothetical protein [Actinomycetota bacterium]